MVDPDQTQQIPTRLLDDILLVPHFGNDVFLFFFASGVLHAAAVEYLRLYVFANRCVL